MFHPASTAASPSDPSLEFTLLSPKETIAIDDVVDQLGRSGLGSMDLVVTDGPPPDVTVAVFDDQDAEGTAGFTTEVLTPSQALQDFTFATLTAPADPANFRLNVGIRTLGLGATVRFSVTDASGVLVAQGSNRTLPPNYFEQNAAATDLGGVQVPANGTISVFVRGTAFIYGATTDNRTNDARFRLFQPE